MRQGGEYFTDPQGPARRRYEALRAYFVEEMPAAEVADRFGYSTASVHQMATLLRTGRLNLFTDPKPGPKGPRKATGELRARVLALRAAGHSVTEIAAAMSAAAGRRPAWMWSRPPGCAAGRPARCPCLVITPGCCCCSRPWPSWACPGWSARPAIPRPGS